ncbi:MAG: DUF134 domain-containing protein [bacterium]|nr:DUF134 domain-containing protein [bacterium]
MPRPCKDRCCRSYRNDRVFKPRGIPMHELQTVELPLDAFEALRLCDAEGLDQTAAAERMKVSRGTVQRLLARARRTVAQALLERQALVITTTNRSTDNACLHSHS